MTVNMLKIGVIGTSKHNDINLWSGTPYYLTRALRKHCGEVYYIGPINSRLEFVGKCINKISVMTYKKRHDFKRSIFFAKRYAKIAKNIIGEKHLDVIFSPAGAQHVAFLEIGVPIVLVLDATFALMKNYYPEFCNLSKASLHQANAVAKLAVQKASLLLYASHWAARSGISDYDADEEKVHVVPFGANLEEEDIPPREMIFNKVRSDNCRLLFLGVDWARKGGNIAFEALLHLIELGVRANLTVCGCMPPENFSHECMTVIPFLDKNDRVQRAKLLNLFLTSDFLLLPTRSEAFGLVFCEANAFGIPAITTNTGGVSTVVKNGENGFIFPVEAGGDDYALIIRDLWKNQDKYLELVQSSRLAFERRLNWDVWGLNIKKLLSKII
jgi:glycosyltransferase involved in cell wall biosynthesis